MEPIFVLYDYATGEDLRDAEYLEVSMYLDRIREIASASGTDAPFIMIEGRKCFVDSE